MKLRDKFIEGVALGLGFAVGSAIISLLFAVLS